jgi:ribosomal protein S18 acetylase RimI-like enzyme
MNVDVKLVPWSGDFEEVLPFLHLSTGVKDTAGIKQLFSIEQTRGTKYILAYIKDKAVGLIGYYYDEQHIEGGLEPPQIIDFAVLPDYRKLGIGKKLMQCAENSIQKAGYTTIWLTTDGNSEVILNIYTSLGYNQVTAVADWFGSGTKKAVLRKDL